MGGASLGGGGEAVGAVVDRFEASRSPCTQPTRPLNATRRQAPFVSASSTSSPPVSLPITGDAMLGPVLTRAVDFANSRSAGEEDRECSGLSSSRAEVERCEGIAGEAAEVVADWATRVEGVVGSSGVLSRPANQSAPKPSATIQPNRENAATASPLLSEQDAMATTKSRWLHAWVHAPEAGRAIDPRRRCRPDTGEAAREFCTALTTRHNSAHLARRLAIREPS